MQVLRLGSRKSTLATLGSRIVVMNDYLGPTPDSPSLQISFHLMSTTSRFYNSLGTGSPLKTNQVCLVVVDPALAQDGEDHRGSVIFFIEQAHLEAEQ